MLEARDEGCPVIGAGHVENPPESGHPLRTEVPTVDTADLEVAASTWWAGTASLTRLFDMFMGSASTDAFHERIE